MIKLTGVTGVIQREPVAFQGCVQATLAALVGFGVVNWSNEQLGLLMAMVAAFLAFITRAAVTPKSAVTLNAPDRQPDGAAARTGDDSKVTAR